MSDTGILKVEYYRNVTQTCLIIPVLWFSKENVIRGPHTQLQSKKSDVICQSNALALWMNRYFQRQYKNKKNGTVMVVETKSEWNEAGL